MVSSADRARAERLVRARTARQRSSAGLAAAIVGLIGVVIALGPAYGATTTTVGAVAMVVGGLAMIGLAVLLVTARVLQARADARTRQVWGASGPAIEIGLRRYLPWVRVLVGGAGAVFLALGAVAIGGGGYVLLLPALLLALLVPDALVAVGGRPVLRFDGAGIGYDGWSVEASVRWEDVERVELESSGVTQRRVLVVVKPGADSYRPRWRRIVLPVDRRPKDPGFGVPMAALDEPVRVRAVLADLVTMPAQLRAGYVEREQTIAFLTGR